ncbi:MAG: prolyl oligopeptidase family serine peptidase, partial [Pedosphaera parvula]|nr:prolyl oligopeptidase family serine peptidase [Pedosphaera parvula]
SVQPYGLVVPPTYKAGSGHWHRLDFWFHGRGDTLTELAFIAGREARAGEFAPEDTFVLHPYGRYCNAYKFAGEVDVFETLEHARRHYPIDAERISARGFSMGGAAAWHIGAHYAGRWVAVNPGAGFVDVMKYQKLEEKLNTVPWYEQKLWNLYDALACPINLVNTKLVAYSGELDAQKVAADYMEQALAAEGIKMTHIIGPNTEHRYEPEAKKKVTALMDEAAAKGVNHLPRKISFVTHTLKYNQMHWVTVDALEKHWEQARVDAEVLADGVQLKTANIAAFTLDKPAASLPASLKVRIDGQEIQAPAPNPFSPLHFKKPGGRWQAIADSAFRDSQSALVKRH